MDRRLIDVPFLIFTEYDVSTSMDGTKRQARQTVQHECSSACQLHEQEYAQAAEIQPAKLVIIASYLYV